MLTGNLVEMAQSLQSNGLSILLVMLWLKRRYVVVNEESGSGDPVPSTWNMEWGY